MNKEILTVVEVVSNEKGVSKDIIFEALEAALMSATQRRFHQDVDIRVSINRHTGDYEAFRRWEVIDDTLPEFPERQLLLSEARKLRTDINPGQFIEQPIEAAALGRIAAQTARQVIVQKVREAERAQIVEAYQSRKGQLVAGIVKRLERGTVTLELSGNVEGLILREEMIPREAVRMGDRLRGYLNDVRAEKRGPQLFVSRTATEFLIELFKIEVPEIGEGLIQTLGPARDPGLPAKVAVRGKDPRSDRVRACVGAGGTRVQAVSNQVARRSD